MKIDSRTSFFSYQGTTIKEIEKAFEDSIDDYLDWCKERAIQSGKK
jgi:predicted HicB family RNase H-like nuclease